MISDKVARVAGPSRDGLNLVVQRPHSDLHLSSRPHSDLHWHLLAQVKVKRHNDSREGKAREKAKAEGHEPFGTSKGSARIDLLNGSLSHSDHFQPALSSVIPHSSAVSVGRPPRLPPRRP